MSFCPPELLDDLADVLATVRGWEGVVEKKPGVFYVRSAPFLHFHLLEGGRRRVDIKGRSDWAQFELARPAPATKKRALLRELVARYDEKRPARRPVSPRAR